MAEDFIISFSRLASDLDAQVAGVWFDQSTIQLRQKWYDEIMDGIRECKAFILVLSPDAMASRYVREEVNQALELGKTIIPLVIDLPNGRDSLKRWSRISRLAIWAQAATPITFSDLWMG